ncbi:restriction endonuclease subunit S [Emticicia sp. W12TSBA100-4]|uniref:restriction endonuclease subunit S n=1 Tax=Emticicia sp. W12TSBA100-4 TaxID=3160965 RepID=UPI0033058FAD
MNWKKVKLGEICQNLDGKRKPLNNIERQKIRGNGKYPYFGANNIMDWVDEYIFDEKILCIAEDGGSWGAGQKCCFIYTGKCWVNNHAHVLKAKEGVSTEFLMYYLNFSDLNSYITGSTRGKLTKSSLDGIKIPLPDLATQKHIAEVLDKADTLRQQNRQLLAHYDELLQSTFIELFGDPVKNPKGWEVKKLDKICTQITDGTHFSPPSVDSGVPYITAKHVKDYGVDFYSKPTYVSIEEHEKIYARCKPEKGDVLYIKDGATTGIAAVNPYDFEFSMLSSLALIKPQKKELTSQFLVSWLNSEQVKENLINEFMAGAAIKRFTLQKIKSFQIPVPPLTLQQHFAKIVEQIEAQKAQTQTALTESEALFEGLLAGYFN